MRRRSITIAALVPASLLAGAVALAATGGAPVQVAEEAAATVVGSGNPLMDLEHPRGGEERFVGRIVEMQKAGPYTYASVDTGGVTRWVVMLRAGSLGPGDPVVVKNM